MLRPELLKILVCPESQAPLELADRQLLDQVNAAIAAGKLVNRAGQTLAGALDGGLVRTDGAVLYPIVDDIPMMLVDEGVLLDQPGLKG